MRNQNKAILKKPRKDLSTKVRKKLLLECLRKNLGLVTYACKEANIHNCTHYEWYKLDPEYRAAVDSLQDVVLDVAEGSLYSLVKEKQPAAVMFLLKCKGKKRGYIEQNYLEMSGKLEVKTDVAKFADELTDEQLEAVATGSVNFSAYAGAADCDSKIDIEGEE